jgi:restriction system protein
MRRKKVYGLGYHLLILVYRKSDDDVTRSARLSVEHAVFIASEQTGDYQTTRGLGDILDRDGNVDDVVAFLEERNLPLDETGRQVLAERILQQPPEAGYLTVSNALQWRLQYNRAIGLASEGSTIGVENLLE